MTILLQLGRLGDLMILLPAVDYLKSSGLDARLMCCGHYADLLGLGCIPFAKTERDWREAYDLARTFTDDVRVTQIGGTGIPKIQPNFVAEFFHRAGAPLSVYTESPLNLPRWPDVERRLVAKHVRTHKPLILYNFQSCSFRIDQGQAVTRWLDASFGHGCELVDLGRIRVEKMSHLLGLYERAAILVTVDTSTLHLGWQTRTPTAAILNDNFYAAPPPRPHWQWAYPYGVMDSHLDDLREAVSRATGVRVASARYTPELPPPDLAPFIRELEGGEAGDDMVSRRARTCAGCEHADNSGGPVVTACKAWPGAIWNYIRNPFERCICGKWAAEA